MTRKKDAEDAEGCVEAPFTAVAVAFAMLNHHRLSSQSTLGPAQELWLNNVQAADFARMALEQLLRTENHSSIVDNYSSIVHCIVQQMIQGILPIGYDSRALLRRSVMARMNKTFVSSFLHMSFKNEYSDTLPYPMS